MGKEGLGNFASGFLQGFAGEFKAHRQRQHEQEQRELDQKWQMVNQIAKDPTTTPDMLNIIARDLFGKSLKGKEEKEALNTVLGLYGQHIIPSQQAQSSEAQIDQAVSKGAGQEELAQMSRPRMSMTATPRYSPEQMTQMAAARQGAMTTAQRTAEEPFEQREADRTLRQQMTLEEMKGQNRKEVEQIKAEARASGDVNKLTSALISERKAALGRDLTSDELRELEGQAGQMIVADKKATTDLKTKRISATDNAIKRGNAYIAHLKVKERQADEQLAIARRNATSREALVGLQQQRDNYAKQRDKIEQNLRRVGQLQTEFNNWSDQLENPLSKPEEKERTRGIMRAIENQQIQLEQENEQIRNQIGAPDPDSQSMTQTGVTTYPPPTMTPKAPPITNVPKAKLNAIAQQAGYFKPDGSLDLEKVKAGLRENGFVEQADGSWIKK